MRVFQLLIVCKIEIYRIKKISFLEQLETMHGNCPKKSNAIEILPQKSNAI